MNDEISLNKFLSDVDLLLKRVETESTHYILTPTETELAACELASVSKDILDTFTIPANDGRLEITITPDGLNALGDFYPASGKGNPILMEQIIQQLKHKSILFGIRWPLIKESLLAATTHNEVVKGILIAAGIPPKDEVPEHWKVMPQLLDKQRFFDQKESFRDFKNDSPFVVIKKDAVLARVIPAQTGCHGTDLTGAEVRYKTLTPFSPHPGKNVVRKNQEYIANVNGCFYCDGSFFWIESILILGDGVSPRTGHISFPGDVFIRGEVAIGYKINTGGSLYSSSTLDVTEINCKGNVKTAQGIIGHPGSVLRSEGKIQAKFLTNAYVLARGKIEVQSAIVNSLVQTLETLNVGSRGLIIGGKLEALKGVNLYQVGNERSGGTQIVCGVDFSVLDKIKWLRDQNILLSNTQKKIEGEITKDPESRSKYLETLGKIQDEIKKLNQISIHLLHTLDMDESAEVKIRGTIYPGSQIEICHVIKIITSPMTHVRFFLNKQKGILSHASL